MKYEDTTDVVVLVIRNRTDDGDYYLIAKDRSNDFWEFVGGKMKKEEEIEEAVFRELADEIEIDWGEDKVDIVKTGGSFKSPQNEVYTLKPVLLDVDSDVAWELGDEDLSPEHTNLKWIRLEEIDDYETFGEKEALQKLDLI